jgi:hypothetical protein
LETSHEAWLRRGCTNHVLLKFHLRTHVQSNDTSHKLYSLCCFDGSNCTFLWNQLDLASGCCM